MKSIKNRVLSGVLAGALAVSMAVPAFATNTEITATYAAPTIEVTVPQTGAAVINPYGMPVKIHEDTTTPANDVSIVGAQVVTKPLAIVNNGETNLKVSATVTTETTGDLRIATSKPSSSDTTKNAYVYLQMTNSTLDVNNKKGASDQTDIAGLKVKDVADAVKAWAQRTYDSKKDVLLSSTAAATKEDILVLKASDANGDAQVGSVGLFRLAGQVVTSPREAWAATDGFKATVAFSFKPEFSSAEIDNSAVTVKASSSAPDHTAVLNVTLEGTEVVDVDWESDDTDKATVVKDGTDSKKATVTGVAAGTANVTATITASNGLTYEVTCAVTVE